MPGSSPITIDVDDQFEHLPNAPIVEAVIQLVARAEVARSSDELKAVLNEALPEYPTVKSVGLLSFTLPVVPAAIGPSVPAGERPKSERAWHGLRLETSDALNVAVFTRDYFSFSRLKPYHDWGAFRAEALRLWAHSPALGVGLLLDIDVLCPEPTPPDSATIEDRLDQMHWIKNRVFFDNVTEKALDLCR